MNKKILMFAILGMFLLSFVAAESIGVYKINEEMQITNYCQIATCTYMNITSIELPNNTILYLNTEMTNNFQIFSYSFIPTENGEYFFTTCGNPDNNFICNKDTFYVTEGGNEKPGSSVIIFFSLLFLIIVITMLTFLFNVIFRMISWDFDARDLIFNISAYFGIFTTYILSKQYLGSQFVNEFLVWFVGVGAFTMVILPLIAFFMSIVKGNLKSNE
jgi:hypothetical protein